MQDNSAPVVSESEPKQKGLKGLKTGTIIAIIFGTVAILSAAIIIISTVIKSTIPNGQYVFTALLDENGEVRTDFSVEQFGKYAITINFKLDGNCTMHTTQPQAYGLILGDIGLESYSDDDPRANHTFECSHTNDHFSVNDGPSNLEYSFKDNKVYITASGNKMLFEKYYGTDMGEFTNGEQGEE